MLAIVKTMAARLILMSLSQPRMALDVATAIDNTKGVFSRVPYGYHKNFTKKEVQS